MKLNFIGSRTTEQYIVCDITGDILNERTLKILVDKLVQRYKIEFALGYCATPISVH